MAIWNFKKNNIDLEYLFTSDYEDKLVFINQIDNKDLKQLRLL